MAIFLIRHVLKCFILLIPQQFQFLFIMYTFIVKCEIWGSFSVRNKAVKWKQLDVDVWILFPLWSHSGAQCITCSYKATSGLLYPLERGFIYVHKPPVHLRFEEISCVNFARGTTTTRSFDFEIETKQGSQYTFSSIERYITLPRIPLYNTACRGHNYIVFLNSCKHQQSCFHFPMCGGRFKKKIKIK